MIEIPAHAVEPTLVGFARRRLKLLAAGRWHEACCMIDEPNCYGITWTPERIQLVVEESFPPGCRFRRRHPEGIRWSDPDSLGNERHPEIHYHDDGSRYALDHDVPLNGEWSDLTAQFQFLRRPQGYAVVLHDVHVL